MVPVLVYLKWMDDSSLSSPTKDGWSILSSLTREGGFQSKFSYKEWMVPVLVLKGWMVPVLVLKGWMVPVLVYKGMRIQFLVLLQG